MGLSDTLPQEIVALECRIPPTAEIAFRRGSLHEPCTFPRNTDMSRARLELVNSLYCYSFAGRLFSPKNAA